MLVPTQLLAAIRQPAFAYLADGTVGAANDRAEALAGGPLAGMTPADVIARFSVRRRDGANVRPHELPTARALAGGEAVEVPLRITAADGRTMHVLASAAPIRDAGEVVGALSIWQDVTGLVAAEEALQTSEERFRTIVETANEGIITVDAESNITYVNRRFAEMLGYAPEDLPGKNIRAFFDPASLDIALAERERRMRTGETARYEARMVRRDGSRVDVQVSASALLDRHGAFAGSLGMVTEITEWKLAEAALRKSEEEYRHIVEHAPTGIYEIDYSGPRFRRVNDAMCEILGYTREELLAMDPGALLDEESRERFRERVRAVLAGKPIDTSVAFRLFAKDGREIWGALEVKPTFTDGRMDGALVVAHDVTERRRMEEAMRDSEAKYRGLVDLAPDGVVVHERGIIRYANPAAARLLRAPGPDALVGINILDLVHPGDRPTGSSRVDAVQDRSQTTPLWEFRFLIDGEVIHADAIAGPIIWEGEPAVQVVLRDISARKQAEAALAESEERHRRLFETMLQGVVYQDADGTIVTMNPAAEGILGKGPAEFLGGSSVGEEWHTLREDGSPFPGLEHPAMVALRNGEAVRDVVMGVYNPREHGYRWISVTAVPLFRPGGTAPYQVYTLFADITERRRMEEALRESEAKYRSLFDSLDAGFCVIEVLFDAAGTPVDYVFLEANPAFMEQTGLRDAIGKRIRELNPAQEEHWFRIFGEIAKTGQPRRFVESAVLIGGWFEVYAFPIGEPGANQVAVLFTDITERKRAEEVLRETRDYLDSLINYANAPIIVWDPDLRITRFNAAFEHLSGYAADEVIGRDLAMLFPEESRAASLAEIERTSTEQWQSVEIPIQRPDGGVRIALWNSANIYDTEGSTLLATIAQGQDITERIEAEWALRESDARQGFLVRLNDALAPLADPVEIQEAATRVLAEQLGADRVAYFEVIGGDYVVEHDYARSVPHIAGRYPVGSFGPRLLAVYRSGTTAVGDDVEADPDLSPDERAEFAAIRIRAYIGVPLVKAGAFVAGLAVHMQTPRAWTPGEVALVEETAERTWAAVERARSEEALRESEGRFRSVLDHSLDALYRLNLQTGRYEYASPAFERVVGRTAEEMASADPGEAMAWIHPDDMPVVEAALVHLEETGAVEIDYRLRDRDGRYRWVSNHLSLIRDGSGRPLYRDGIIRDVSAQKEAEEALREYAENLKRSNEDLERFAYVSSHDLQEPLRAIVSFSQLLERRYRGQLGHDADEYIEFIVEGGIRMQTLIQDLLAFSRVNTTRQQIARTDAEDVLAEAVRSLDVSLREAGATITHDPLPVVMADPTQLAQVFSNLVSNAVKFRRPDKPLQIHVGARRLDGFWEFSVADNGIGIEKDYFEKIFVIFQRLHTKDAYPGTGIGLAIVKRIIDRHGGRIWLESTPGAGSTFFFTLPAA